MSSAEKRPRRSRRRAVSARSLARLPIFPLPELVFFPGTVLPLHIFEPRYRKMTRDALDGNRLLAVGMQLEPELPDRLPPRFAPILTVGEIMVAEPLPDGRFNLVLQGRARIRLVDELETDEPYRLIKAAEVPDEEPTDLEALAEAESSLRAIVDGLCAVLPEGGALLRQVVASQGNPSELANVLASTLVLDAPVRQGLLETVNVTERLERLAEELAGLTGRFSERTPTN